MQKIATVKCPKCGEDAVIAVPTSFYDDTGILKCEKCNHLKQILHMKDFLSKIQK